MRSLIRRLKGFPGDPSHPPLTAASVGAYTLGGAMLVVGALASRGRAASRWTDRSTSPRRDSP
jgi:hypothetical protein